MECCSFQVIVLLIIWEVFGLNTVLATRCVSKAFHSFVQLSHRGAWIILTAACLFSLHFVRSHYTVCSYMACGMTEDKIVQCKCRHMMLCILVVQYHHFRGTCGLHLQLLFLCHILDCKLMIVKGPGNSSHLSCALNFVSNTCHCGHCKAKSV